jgi:hypothetical protein
VVKFRLGPDRGLGTVRLALDLHTAATRPDLGAEMPRKSKGLKSKLRDAATACKQGKKEEANNIWRQVAADRLKLKADKAAKRAEKKAKAK